MTAPRTLIVSTAAALAILDGAPAAASPFGAVVLGPALGEETGIGGALGGRAGWRTPPGPTRWGGFVEVTGLYFLGFGPHSHLGGTHALLAGEWTRGRGTRAHLFAGVGLDHWGRGGTEHDQQLDTWVVSGALGAGVGFGPARLDLEGSVTLIELARATDSPVVGPQVMLLLSLGRP